MHIYIIINFSACLFLFCLTLPSSHDHLARTRGKANKVFLKTIHPASLNLVQVFSTSFNTECGSAGIQILNV